MDTQRYVATAAASERERHAAFLANTTLIGVSAVSTAHKRLARLALFILAVLNIAAALVVAFYATGLLHWLALVPVACVFVLAYWRERVQNCIAHTLFSEPLHPTTNVFWRAVKARRVVPLSPLLHGLHDDCLRCIVGRGQELSATLVAYGEFCSELAGLHTQLQQLHNLDERETYRHMATIEAHVREIKRRFG